MSTKKKWFAVSIFWITIGATLTTTGILFLGVPAYFIGALCTVKGLFRD